MAVFAAIQVFGTVLAEQVPFEGQLLFRSGDGYAVYRIPAVVATPDGTVLAFAEARPSANDAGNIDLVLRRSTDGGKTWGALQVVRGQNDDDHKCGNPQPVVDARRGKVLLLSTYNHRDHSEPVIRNGNGVRAVFVQESADNGATWSAPRDISAMVKPTNFLWYATGPGHAIQLERGPRAGRLVAACNHSVRGGYPGGADFGAHLIYSDDGGQTWKVGGIYPGSTNSHPNESTVVELTDGRLYLNSRDQGCRSPGTRAVAYSADAGETHDPATFRNDHTHVTPECQNSVLRYSATDKGGARDLILYSAPSNWTARVNLTVWSSFDETRSWSRSRLVAEGNAGYSDMARLPDGSVGLLYERGRDIVWACLTKQWLAESDQ
jgi:sialidase-1